MIRVVHLFDLKKGVHEDSFVEWLDARLDAATRQFGCLDRKTWILLDGLEGSYTRPKSIKKKQRPRFVNEAYWNDISEADRFREWLTGTPEGRELHDKWFGSIENHIVLRYVAGWSKIPMTG